MASTNSSDKPTVLIHGNVWKVSDIRDDVAWCLVQNWNPEEWKPSAALVHKKGGTSSQYAGQRFDREKIDLVEDGWTHDHCSICWWTLFETNNKEEGAGYKNEGNSWLCAECFDQFVRDDVLDLKTTANKRQENNG